MRIGKMKAAVIPVIFTGFALLTSCGLFGGGKEDVSPTTGWNYNDPDNGGFEPNKIAKLTTPPPLPVPISNGFE